MIKSAVSARITQMSQLPPVFTQWDVFREILSFLEPFRASADRREPGYLCALAGVSKSLLEVTKECAAFPIKLDRKLTWRYLEVPEFRLLVLSRIKRDTTRLSLDYSCNYLPWSERYVNLLAEAGEVALALDWATADKIKWFEIRNNVKSLELQCDRTDSVRAFDLLSHLNGITDLSFSANKVDFKGLEKLKSVKKLEIEFSEEWRNENDALSKLQNLVELEIEGNGMILSLANIGRPSQLNRLRVYTPGFVDMEVLANCPNLRWVTLGTDAFPVRTSAAVCSLEWLRCCPQLEGLWLGGWQIADLTPLTDLKTLSYLRLANCTVSEYAILSNLTPLKCLFLNSTDFGDLAVLQRLNNLKQLNCFKSLVPDVDLALWRPRESRNCV